MSPLPPLRGLRHLALKVTDMTASRAFYEGLLGMKIVWEPDPHNVYLSSGLDNLALHQIAQGERDRYRQGPGQFLDHFGFIVPSPADVDGWHDRLTQAGATILKPPKKHRDGSVSCYVADPDGNSIQFLYEPTLSEQRAQGPGSGGNKKHF